METLFIPTENDFKKWIKEAVKECMQEAYLPVKSVNMTDDSFLNRKEVAKFLRISLVTLTDWMKRGLPSHQQRGRIILTKKKCWIISKREK
jgi:hypothetical protein